jgi:large subunit ribosomal protein L24
MKKRMKVGDLVVAIAGNNRGQTGKILKILGDKAVVQGLNVRKRHMKRSQQNPQGKILDLEKPIHLSNLQISDEEGKPLKLKVRQNEKNGKELVYREGKDLKVYRSVKKHNV